VCFRVDAFVFRSHLRQAPDPVPGDTTLLLALLYYNMGCQAKSWYMIDSNRIINGGRFEAEAGGEPTSQKRDVGPPASTHGPCKSAVEVCAWTHSPNSRQPCYSQ
jgi:hypothetical protein